MSRSKSVSGKPPFTLVSPVPAGTYFEYQEAGLLGGSPQRVLINNEASRTVGTLTCTFADLTLGKHRIELGDWDLVPGQDFPVGANDNTLAENLADTIEALPTFTASVVGNVITIQTLTSVGSLIHIKVLENGAASAFALSQIDFFGVGDEQLKALRIT